MELHALDSMLLVAQTHDLTLRRMRTDFEGRRKFGLDEQGMIAHRLERIGEAREDRFTVVDDRRGLAVHQPRSAHDPAAERLTDTLMTQADAEHRNFTGKLAQQRDGNARFGRG